MKAPVLMVLTIIVLCLLFVGCSLLAVSFLIQFLDRSTNSPSTLSSQESFYTPTGGSDYRRMALLEPYQAISINKTTWSIKLLTHSIRYQSSINEIESLAVIDQKYIVTYSLDTIYSGSRVSELWFVIVPETQYEQGFLSQTEVLTFLQTGTNIQTLKLLNANNLYSTLLRQGYLDWFPDKYKK